MQVAVDGKELFGCGNLRLAEQAAAKAAMNSYGKLSMYLGNREVQGFKSLYLDRNTSRLWQGNSRCRSKWIGKIKYYRKLRWARSVNHLPRKALEEARMPDVICGDRVRQNLTIHGSGGHCWNVMAFIAELVKPFVWASHLSKRW